MPPKNCTAFGFFILRFSKGLKLFLIINFVCRVSKIRGMALDTKASCLTCVVSSILLFSLMQIYGKWLSSSPLLTIFGGGLGSVLFIFVLTFVANLEVLLFGSHFQTKLFPEVIFCIFTAVTASGMVHRVCASACLLFSLVALYFINRISQATYVAPAQPVAVGKKRR